MNKLSKTFLALFTALIMIFSLVLTYMYTFTDNHIQAKQSFVKLVGLPDLALANGANYVRHRSLSDTYSLFSNSPELLEFFPSTFTYNYSPIQHNRVSRISDE